ncbi:T9SS type A sorting domain-containing protein [Owenweeksia hongkongensis]|uniref:T9SS type A sorting domain-containing protein n=1 Tax=Owenweeksia hongkongensis TaxID=253245 RepID=UPI003A910E98
MSRIIKIAFLAVALMLGNIEGRAQSNCAVWEWADVLPIYRGTVIFKNIEVDSIGNQYILGSFGGTVTLDSITFNSTNGNYFIGKRDTAREWIWAIQLDIDYALNGPEPFGMHFDDYSQSIILTGAFSQTLTLGAQQVTSGHALNSMFVAKLNTSNQQWVWNRQVMDSISIKGSSVTTTPNGEIYLAGLCDIPASSVSDTLHFGGSALPIDSAISFIAKLTPSGSWKWIRQGGAACAPAVTINSSGLIGFAGAAHNSVKNISHYFVQTYDTAGQFNWTKKIQKIYWGNYGIVHFDADLMGNFYLSGRMHANLKFDSITLTTNRHTQFFTKLDKAGNFKWAQHAGRHVSQSPWAYPKSIIAETTKDGKTIFFGSHHDDIYFGTDTIVKKQGTYDFMSMADSSGNWKLITSLPTLSYYNGNGLFSSGLITSDRSSRIYFVGSNGYNNRMGLDSLKDYHSFIAKINLNGAPLTKAFKDTIVQCGMSVQLKTISNFVATPDYQWYPNVRLDTATKPDPYCDPVKTTVYYVGASTSAACSAFDTVKVFVDTATAFGQGFPISTNGFGKYYCQNSNFSISAPAGYHDFHWSTGDTSQTIFPTEPGKYILIAANANGCYDIDSILLQPLIEIKAPPFLLCTNDSIPLSINTFGLDSVKWSTGSQASQVYASQPGKYWVDAYRGACWATDTVEVILFTDTANANFADSIYGLEVHFAPTSIGVNNGYWDFGDGTYLSGVNVSHTYANPGTYPVCFYSKDICGGEGEQCKNVSVTDIGITELKPIEVFSLFPNPANDILNISSENILAPHILVFDVSGRILLDKHFSKSNNWQLDIQGLPSGYYFIKIGNQTSKFGKL